MKVCYGFSPYEPLSNDIIQYTFKGKVFLNVRTQSRQCTIFKMDENRGMTSVGPSEIGITRMSKDQGVDTTNFGNHLLELGSRQYRMVYKGGQARKS